MDRDKGDGATQLLLPPAAAPTHHAAMSLKQQVQGWCHVTPTCFAFLLGADGYRLLDVTAGDAAGAFTDSGWHIHIGKLAEHARRRHKCQTQAGKDYVIIWVPRTLLQQQQGIPWQPYLAGGSARYTPREPGQRLAQQAAAAAKGSSSSSSSSSSEEVATSKLQPAPGRHGDMPTTVPDAAGGTFQQHPAGARAAVAAAAAGAGARAPELDVLVAYRYGSVVFLRCPAGSVEQDTEVLQRLLQPSMIYHDRSLGRSQRAGGGASSSGWRRWLLAPLLRWYHGGPAPQSATPQQELVQVRVRVV
jgi:hypothetical protein